MSLFSSKLCLNQVDVNLIENHSHLTAINYSEVKDMKINVEFLFILSIF